jgi:hypothetical protein
MVQAAVSIAELAQVAARLFNFIKLIVATAPSDTFTNCCSKFAAYIQQTPTSLTHVVLLSILDGVQSPSTSMRGFDV